MENKTSNISASQYSGKIANAKIPPGTTRILTRYAKSFWIVHVILAFVAVVVGIIMLIASSDYFIPVLIIIISAAALLSIAYITRTIIQAIADLFYNVNIISEMSVINTALEIEKETETNVL